MLLRGRFRLALLALPLLLLSCRPAPRAPGVLLISIDTLRADHVGSYGYPRATTPVLDALAGEGVRFANAFSQSSWTLPSHMSLLTSRYPHGHGAERENQGLSPGVPTLPQVLSGHGMHTAALVSWFYVSARYGFDRGFDEFVELLPEDEDLGAYRRAEEVVDRAIQWLDGLAADEPFFLFVHLFDPHMDYRPPPPYDTQFEGGEGGLADGTYASLQPYIRGLHEQPQRVPAAHRERALALYDGEIRYVDAQVGRLLDALAAQGLGHRTLVVVTSDHGEEFDDHGSMEGHQWTLYDEVLHVPLIVRAPGIAGGRVVDDLVETLDIAPTILDLLGMPPAPEFQGRSLAPLLSGESGEAGHLAYAKTEQFNSKQSVRSSTHKLIHTFDTGTNAFGFPVRPGFELYDLRSDPGEQTNVFSEDSDVGDELRRALLRWLATGEALDPSAEVEFTEEERRRLRSLGYVQ
jgi:arylsulfatase A-like enzyme